MPTNFVAKRRRANRRLLSLMYAVVLASCFSDPPYQSRSADDWGHQLLSGTPAERVLAARAFAAAPPHQFSHVRPLLLAERDPDASVRHAADSALGNLKVDATKAVVRALTDTSVAVRRAAADVLGRLYQEKKRVVPALVGATTDADDSVRTLAVMSLGELGPSAYSAVEVVRRLATTPGPQRAAALVALPDVDTESRSLYSVYVGALTDTSATVRAAAAWMLPLAIGEAQVEPVPVLMRAADDTVPAVRAAAVRALALLSEHDTTALRAMKAIGARGDSSLRRLVDSALTVGPHPTPPPVRKHF